MPPSPIPGIPINQLASGAMTEFLGISAQPDYSVTVAEFNADGLPTYRASESASGHSDPLKKWIWHQTWVPYSTDPTDARRLIDKNNAEEVVI